MKSVSSVNEVTDEFFDRPTGQVIFFEVGAALSSF